jgi:hypothetical protein
VKFHRDTFYRGQAIGSVLQLSSLITLTAQNVIIPRHLGPEGFGIAVSMLAVPLFYQGLLEPLAQCVSARHSGEEGATLFTLSLLAAALVGPTAAAVLLVPGYSRATSFILITLLTFGLTVSTHLTAAAYTAGDYKRLLLAQFGGSLLVVGAVVLDPGRRPLTMVAAVVGFSAVGSIILASSPGTRAQCRSYLPLRWPRLQPGWLAEYAAGLTPRIGTVMLSGGSTVLVSWTAQAPDLAAFRIVLTLIHGAVYLAPLSPPVLRTALSERGRTPQTARKAVRLLLLKFCVSAVLAVLLLNYGDPAVALLAGESFSASSRYRWLYAALPFFAMITPLSAVMQALRSDVELTTACVASCVAYAVATLAGGVVAAFIAGSAVFVLACISGCALAHLSERQTAALPNFCRRLWNW